MHLCVTPSRPEAAKEAWGRRLLGGTRPFFESSVDCERQYNGRVLLLDARCLSGEPAMAHAVTIPPQSAASFERSLRPLRSAGLVRLDDVEAAALAAAVDGIVAESVELFGSRTDPASRGGDIDVLILTSAPRFETSRCVSSRFFMHCEERIDVVVLDPDRRTPAEDAFLQSLRRVRIT
jgi:hypothetical protein